MASPQTGTFLRNLRATGLVDDARVDEIASSPHAADDRALARELVKRKLLTRFQAEQILGGRTQGFFIGPYVVTDRIGAGGMGQVFKAVHRRMERTVALKVLPKASRGDPEAQARFMREVKASAQLIHPNIVTAFDVGEEGDITYLAMEYVQGQDLYHLIHSQGHLDPAGAANIAYQVALALAHAHEHGIVHRDIKPSNILVTDRGVAKVLDMGLARIEHAVDDESSRLTSEGVVMGTLDYIAPEQANDTHHADIRADIYSLGCALYHMLTGQVPFPGGGPTEKLCAHAMKSPTDPSALVPDVPPDMSAVMTRMMAKRPEDRYQTPTEVATALLPWVGPAAAPSLSAVSPGPSPGPPPGVAQPPSAVSPGPSPGLPPGVAQPPPAVSPGPAPPSLPSVSDDTISRPAPPAPPPPSTMTAQALAGLQVHGLGRKGRVSRLIVRAESMHTHWRALHQALKAKRPQPDRVADLTQSLRTDYKHLPHILDPVGAPGRTVMSLIQSGATAAELRAQTADLERGQHYLHEFVDFLKAVLRRLNEKSVLSYQAGVIIDFLKERKAKPASTLIAAGCVVVAIFLLSLIPGRQADKPPEPSPPALAPTPSEPTARPTPPSPAVSPPAASLHPEPEFPIVRADASGKGPYKTLKEAFADVKSGEDVVIELRTNGVLRAGDLKLSCRRVTLRAGEGFQPIVAPPATGGCMVSLDAKQSVTVENLHFVSWARATAFCIWSKAPVVRVVGCTQQSVHGQSLYLLDVNPPDPSDVEVRDCFFAGGSLVSGLFVPIRRLAMSNCAGRVTALMEFRGVLPTASSHAVEVRLTRNTLAFSSHPIRLVRLKKGSCPKRVTLFLSGNVFLPLADRGSNLVMIAAENAGDNDPQVSEWTRAVRWQGADNVIGAFTPAVITRMRQEDGSYAYSDVFGHVSEFLRSWGTGLAHTCSALITARFTDTGMPGSGPRRQDIDQLRSSLPRGWRQIGADLSRIPEPPVIDASGKVIRPGKPPARPRPAEPTEATAAEPAFPIVRADGSGKGPYKTLKEAFADCKPDEDVAIEIHTNGVLEATSLAMKGRNVVLRAGPGFRPILRYEHRRAAPGSAFVFYGYLAGSLVLEGLHFVSDHFWHIGLAGDIAIVQIRGCTFSGINSPLSLRGRTREVLVRDCAFLTVGTALRFTGDAGRVRVSNCAGLARVAVCIEPQPKQAGRAGRIHVSLSRSSFVLISDLSSCVVFGSGTGDQAVPEQVSMDVAESILLPLPGNDICALVTVKCPGDARVPVAAKWKRATRWDIRNNVIGRCTMAVRTWSPDADQRRRVRPVVGRWRSSSGAGARSGRATHRTF